MRGIRAVETFARKGQEDNPSGPVEFYLRNGFRVFRDDPEYPLMRLELYLKDSSKEYNFGNLP
jgi:hypothetical protein